VRKPSFTNTHSLGAEGVCASFFSCSSMKCSTIFLPAFWPASKTDLGIVRSVLCNATVQREPQDLSAFYKARPAKQGCQK
jgi:hypothetical protein